MEKIFRALFCFLILACIQLHSQTATPRLQGSAGITSLPASEISASHTRDAAAASGIAALQELRPIVPILTDRMKMHTFQIESAALKSGDTLFIGPGNDSLVINGAWNYKGAIVVIGNGRLIFDNATATIVGNITVWGDHAQLLANNSTLYFPQEYFYQRNLVAAGGCRISLRNTTMDYSGLSHNLVLTDSAVVEYHNVTYNGFTTAGVYGKSRIFVDTCNVTGEFILQDEARIDFRNASNILLWHCVERGQQFHVTFPDGTLVGQYALNAATPGLAGIRFDVSLTNCTDVMWALMPKPGSDVKIANSKIRAIGVWFTGVDSTDASGLVNNSTYPSFTAPLNDRSFVLENTTVQTWSLYSFDASIVNVKGCVVGEIGAFGHSKVTCTNVMVDGSGGYLFASDNAVILFGFSSATCPVRSERNGILIFAYSSLPNGSATAIGSSILIVAQSAMIDDPVPLEGSVAWLAQVSVPASANAGTKVQINGSAWIDKAPQSVLFDFKKYVLSYQKSGDAAWTKIADTVFTEVHDGVLGEWNTSGLTPGQYNVRLTLVSDTPDQFAVDATKSINILPAVSDVTDVPSAKAVTVFPNPASDFVQIMGVVGEYVIFDVLGTEKLRGRIAQNEAVDISRFERGLYFLKVQGAVFTIVKK